MQLQHVIAETARECVSQARLSYATRKPALDRLAAALAALDGGS